MWWKFFTSWRHFTDLVIKRKSYQEGNGYLQPCVTCLCIRNSAVLHNLKTAPIWIGRPGIRPRWEKSFFLSTVFSLQYRILGLQCCEKVFAALLIFLSYKLAFYAPEEAILGILGGKHSEMKGRFLKDRLNVTRDNRRRDLYRRGDSLQTTGLTGMIKDTDIHVNTQTFKHIITLINAQSHIYVL